MKLVRQNPWTVFNTLNHELNSLLVNDGRFSNQASEPAPTLWAPAVDIQEQDNNFLLVADIPGVDPAAIEITVDGGELTIKGERTDAAKVEQKGNGYRRVERLSGRFERRFRLPETIDADNVSAKGEHGVLTITLPKQEKAQPKRIAVAA